MKLHTCFITHNRLELTQQAVASYLATVEVEHTIAIVDNASTDGTREWLGELPPSFTIYLLDENRYPGYACNLGWSCAPADADVLHRADNDFVFLPGWCKQVERLFRNKKTGQIGLRTNEEEVFAAYNVGGNNVIRRRLWDKGLRYDERTWPEICVQIGPGQSEDSLFSPAIKKMGFSWVRVKQPAIKGIASGDATSDPYYVKSFSDRGIVSISE